MTTIISGLRARTSAIASGSLIPRGCKSGAPGGRALPIGDAWIRCSRPTGLSCPVTTPTSSCSVESISACRVGTPIAPVPRKRTRMGALWCEPDGGTTRAARGRCLRHQLFPRAHFALADRRAAAGAKIIEQLAVGQDQEQPLAHGHAGPAFGAVKRGGGEILKLLLRVV